MLRFNFWKDIQFSLMLLPKESSDLMGVIFRCTACDNVFLLGQLFARFGNKKGPNMAIQCTRMEKDSVSSLLKIH